MHLTQRRRGGWVIGDTENRFATTISLFPWQHISSRFVPWRVLSATLSFPRLLFFREQSPLPWVCLVWLLCHLFCLLRQCFDRGTKGGSQLHRQSSLCYIIYCASYHVQRKEKRRLTRNFISTIMSIMSTFLIFVFYLKLMLNNYGYNLPNITYKIIVVIIHWKKNKNLI